MTDAMSMGAIAGTNSTGEAAVRAVQAGNDILAYTSPEMTIEAYQAILSAVRSGAIPQSRIEEAARRIVELKARAGLFDARLPDQADIAEVAHRDLARQISQQAITLVGSAQPPLLKEKRVLLVSPDALPSGSVPGDNYTLLGELLRNRGVEVDEWIYSVEDAGQSAVIQSQLQRAMPGYPHIVLVTYDAWLRQQTMGDRSQVNLLNSLISSNVPLTLVAIASPYDLKLVSATQPALATYGSLDVQVEALVDALLADSLPSGKLPVPLAR
jgi:beta-N-acetylhexosaminidase